MKSRVPLLAQIHLTLSLYVLCLRETARRWACISIEVASGKKARMEIIWKIRLWFAHTAYSIHAHTPSVH